MEQRTYQALDMTSPAAQRALARCKANKPRVHVVSLDAGIFSVPSRQANGDHYIIRLLITPNGKCLHECTCAGGKSGQLCVHVVGCFLVWGGIVAARQEAERLKKAQQERIERESAPLVKPEHQRIKFDGVDV